MQNIALQTPGSNPGRSILIKMIKAIIFDNGGVVSDQTLLLKKFTKIFKPKSRKKFLQDINLCAIPLCKNKISEAEYWIRISKLYPIPY